jgi:hypothetical protein
VLELVSGFAKQNLDYVVNKKKSMEEKSERGTHHVMYARVYILIFEYVSTYVCILYSYIHISAYVSISIRGSVRLSTSVSLEANYYH